MRREICVKMLMNYIVECRLFSLVIQFDTDNNWIDKYCTIEHTHLSILLAIYYIKSLVVYDIYFNPKDNDAGICFIF